MSVKSAFTDRITAEGQSQSGIRHQASGIRHQASGIRQLYTSFK